MSVLLPSRDAARTLPAALDSLRAQRGAPPFEVVLVDDASTDDTRGVLRAYPEVRVVAGRGAGLVAALNDGLAACRGEWIARMDADDVAHPDRLRMQCALLAAKPRLGAVGSLVRCVPRPLTPGLARLEALLNATVTEEQCRNARFIEAPLVHPTLLLRRELARYEDHGWAEDWDLQLRILEAGFELAKVPEVLLDWHDSPARLTRTGAVYRAERMIELRAHYLARGPLRGRPFAIWGAGPTGKRLARALEAHGCVPRGFYDLDPRKQRARGQAVLPRDALPPPGEVLLIAAVGAAGAREDIGAMLSARGYKEGPDYLFAA